MTATYFPHPEMTINLDIPCHAWDCSEVKRWAVYEYRRASRRNDGRFYCSVACSARDRATRIRWSKCGQMARCHGPLCDPSGEGSGVWQHVDDIGTRTSRMCRKCRSAARRTSYEANKEQAKATNRAWYEANKDRVRAKNRAWIEANPERHKEIVQAWYENNRDRKRETSRLWHQQNPDRARAYSSKRRAIKSNALVHEVPDEMVWEFNPAGPGCCNYCANPLVFASRATWEVDHVVPLSRGGTHEVGNLVVACVRCNRSKGARLIHEWPNHPQRKETV